MKTLKQFNEKMMEERLMAIVDYNQEKRENGEMDEMITFVYQNTVIDNPIYETTGRFEVDPIEFYGKENIEKIFNEYFEKVLKPQHN